MKKLFLAAFALFAINLVATPCEEVMAMIEEKIKVNGVENFTLEAMNMGAKTEGKIVGVCEAGDKQIVYFRDGQRNKGQEVLVDSNDSKTK